MMKADHKWITLVIADDHPIVLEGIVGVVGAEKDIKVIANCRTGLAAFQAITKLKPEVAVLDISMPEMNGLEILIKLRTEGTETKIILLTANTTDRQLLSAIEHGASALLLKDAPLTELAQTIRSVVAGARCFPAEMVDAALAQLGLANAGNRLAALSPREREVMRLVAEGLINKQVGQRLNLSEGTVKIHLHNIYQKTGIGNRTALTALALADREK
jgi:two-component system nitrate/nitrite response regulator NarL